MSKADEIFIGMCRQILESGYDTKGGESKTEMARWYQRLYNQAVWRCQYL